MVAADGTTGAAATVEGGDAGGAAWLGPLVGDAGPEVDRRGRGDGGAATSSGVVKARPPSVSVTSWTPGPSTVAIARKRSADGMRHGVDLADRLRQHRAQPAAARRQVDERAGVEAGGGHDVHADAGSSTIRVSSSSAGPAGNGVPATTTRWRSGDGASASRRAASSTSSASGTTSGAPATMPEIRLMLAAWSAVEQRRQARRRRQRDLRPVAGAADELDRRALAVADALRRSSSGCRR